MRARPGVVAVLLFATVIATSRTALAQNSWRVSLTPYAWLAGIEGQIGFAGSVTDVSLSVGDVLDRVDIPLAALFEARRGRFLTLIDLNYRASSQRADDGTGGSVLFELENTLIQPEIGYTMVLADWGEIDGLVGGRYWHPRVDVTADGAGGPIPIATGSRSWFDGTAGVRIRTQPAEKWRLFARTDLGAGASKLTWQAAAGATFDISTCCAVAGAYRHLDIDYDRDGLLYDSYMSGFALGLEIRF